MEIKSLHTSCKSYQNLISNLFLLLLFDCSNFTTPSNSELLENLKNDGFSITYKEFKSGNQIVIETNEKTKISNDDLNKICQLRGKITFFLRNVRVEDLNLKYLENCENKIERFDLSSLTLPENFLCNLESSLVVKNFYLGSLDLSDSDLRCLSNLKKIENLIIDGTGNGVRFSPRQFTDEGFCSFARSGIHITHIEISFTDMSEKGLDCVTEINGLESFGFYAWRNFDEADLMKIEDKFLKRNGRPLRAGTFQYERY